MKTTIQIKTGEFEYIMQEFDGTPEQAVDAFKALKASYSTGVGLEPKAWNAWLDRYLKDQTGDADLYAQMSPEQQNVIQNIKRSIKRIAYNEE